MKIKFAKYLSSLVISIMLLSSGCNDKIEQKFLTMNGQVGIQLGSASSLAGLSATINSKDYIITTGIKENITIHFESFGVNPNYKNSININNQRVKTIDENKTDGSLEWTKNSFKVLGLNAIKGQPLAINFKAGGLNNYDPDPNNENVDDFSLRNVYITINNDKNEIWSDQFDKYNYENYNIQLCEGDKSTDQRFTCLLSKTFTFTIPDKYFNIDGVLLEPTANNGSYDIILKKETKTLLFDGKLPVEVNLTDNELITESKVITLNSMLNFKVIKTYLDGVEISLPFTLTKGYWSNGQHTLTLRSEDFSGNISESVYNFTLQSDIDFEQQNNYEIFNYGPSLTLPKSLLNGGVKISKESTLHKDENYATTSFGNNSYQSFTIANADITTPIRWIGKGPKNKPLALYVFNHTANKYDALSTSVNSNGDEVTLATYINDLKYIKDGKINVMVASVINPIQTKNFNSRILWITDTQYLTEKLDYNIGLEKLGNWVESNANNMSIKYIMHTGDLVQLNSNLNQWELSHNLLVSKIINTNIPFGISTGNHDIGAISASCTNGSDCLDDNLDYSQYHSYYSNLNTSGDYNNNRSNYNLVTIDGVDFIFVHLGWGSSISGIHVSKQDIDWANLVLAQHQDRIAIVTSHEYLNRHGQRTATGNYVFNQLVTKNSNVKMVFSGHFQGSALLVDSIDDNNDNIGDRQVIQLLTDFQEEAFGSTYFRLLNLDKANNKIFFQTYSPYFKDYLAADPGLYSYPTVDEFSIHFDLSKTNYGLISDYFG